MAKTMIHVPDVGSSDPVDVIEISVKVGDTIAAEDTIVVLESDKATVEVPAPQGGKVTAIKVKVGDRVKEGDDLLEVDAADDQADKPQDQQPQQAEEAPAPTQEDDAGEAAQKQQEASAPSESAGSETVTVPDLGDIEAAEIIEVNVAVGDSLEPEQVIVVLESDKASLEIPAPKAGKVQSLAVKAGDKVGTGDVLLTLSVSGAAAPAAPSVSKEDKQDKTPAREETAAQHAAAPTDTPTTLAPQAAASSGGTSKAVHAGPAVRKLAREMGVDLAQVSGSGPKSRILKEDVHAWVKQRLEQQPAASAGDGLAVTLPDIDFSQFGEIERVELNKLRRVAAQNLTRSWLTIPHVTQHEQADITDLEAFRKQQNKALEKEGVKLTMLAFLVKACASALQAFPHFNSSLEKSGEALIQKHYINIGIAVDTPNGLVVPVIRDADRKGLKEIAREMGELAEKARNRKLTPADMKGGTFSISSLGGIGGTGFTPIVNWPEVAILGVSRSDMQPVWDGQQFQPRLTLPLSLSYDHRVIDGADAARFCVYLRDLLTDMRRALL
ncbi:pyruvate dehydrogenase, E2 component [Alcanivorax hongdengensis A-11-3]|uniref:Acetyltransferase component of pyruvate dehydrogenase complex n=1 Tax=Alcanivorax hongdengensis A-11-3 TaxID=1177179 RepID=L0WB53_9GAMM|nr:dihydrolipoyllysine-residue acetyltransferase [Alcanivorax hongdengensis]EKF74239.1 pyruvate dehydrogenase, E2 component [Alcanivorax hongdengensis A-11-3]